MATKELWFNYVSYYREGPKLYVYQEEQDYDDLEFVNLTSYKFVLPSKNNIKIFIIKKQYDACENFWDYETSDKENYDDIFLKIFSQIHNHLPYKLKIVNKSHKVEGYYPPVPYRIKALANFLTDNIIERYKEDYDMYYGFLCVMDSQGNLLKHELL